MMRFIILCISLLFCFACSDQKEEVHAKRTFEVHAEPIIKGPIEVNVKLAKKECSILDKQYLVLSVKAPIEFEIDKPFLEERLEDFRLIPSDPIPDEIDGGLLTTHQHIAMDFIQSGDQVIPPLVIKYTSGVGENSLTGNIKTKRIEFKVLPLKEDDERLSKELAPMQDIIRGEPMDWKWILIIAAGVLVLASLVVWLLIQPKKHRKAPKAQVLPAHLQAYAELEALIEQRRQESMSGEDFVNSLSLILRKYIERRFAIQAPELTTEEFLDQIMKRDLESIRVHQAVLQRFLEYCDLVKFATKKTTDDEIQQGFDFIKDFIENTREKEVTH